MGKKRKGRSSRARPYLVLAVFAAYILGFPLLHGFVGSMVVVFSMIPTVFAGWSYGLWAGLVTGILIFPINFLLFTWVGRDPMILTSMSGGLPGTIVIVVMSAFAGRLGDLNNSLKKKLADFRRLASFPEENPNPVVEIDLDGKVTYVNPQALKHFPNIAEQGIKHYTLRGLDTVIEACRSADSLVTIKGYGRTVQHDKHMYEQKIMCLPDGGQLRVYFADITKIKEAEKKLLTQSQEVQAVNDLMVGREIRMAELKKRVRELEATAERSGEQ